jgi:hypothetical protein
VGCEGVGSSAEGGGLARQCTPRARSWRVGFVYPEAGQHADAQPMRICEKASRGRSWLKCHTRA